MSREEELEKWQQKESKAEQEALDAKNNLAEKQRAYSDILDDLVKSGQFTIKEGQDLEKVTKILNAALKERIKQEEIRKKVLEEAIKVDKKLAETKQQEAIIIKQQAEEARKPKGFWQQIKYGGSDTIDWNLDRRINGLNSILSGNFKYGALQIAQSFKIGRNFINHPMVMFAGAAAKLTLALIDFSTKSDRLANRIAGGSLVSPNARNRKWEMTYQDTAMTMMYGQNKEDFYNYKIGTFGAQTKAALALDPRFTKVWSQGRASLQDLGANPDLMNQLLQQQVALGRTSGSMEKFNYKLIKSLQGLDKLGSDQFIQNLTNLNKTFLANNINGLANAESLKRFQDQLNKGTLTIADFTQGLTSRRGAETSTLAGVGAMLAERGLGGKELQDAYARGDMIAVAGAVRRGGMQMQKDIEKIAPELARQMGTSDWREALALQSGTPWGQMTGDLKKIDIQDILSKGGSLTIAVDGKDIKLDNLAETEDFKNIDKELIKTTVDNTNALQALTNFLQIGGLSVMKDFEKDKLGTLTNVSKYVNPFTAPMNISKVIAEFIIGNPNQ